jgi:hypothetical protein
MKKQQFLLLPCSVLLLASTMMCSCKNAPPTSTTGSEPSTVQDTTSTPKIYGASGIRGARYCEILAIHGRIGKLSATVYNTLGCNDCPPEIWATMNPKKIKKELNALEIELNGPRVFLMDKIGQSNTPPPTTTISGLDMKERATVPLPTSTILRGKSKPYTETTVNRSTEFVFSKGSKTYQLISPEHQYIMQSYAQIVDPNLKEADLAQLGTRLKLPKGWRFQVVTLEADLVLRTFEGGEAHVTQDELTNTYQRFK